MTPEQLEQIAKVCGPWSYALAKMRSDPELLRGLNIGDYLLLLMNLVQSRSPFVWGAR